MKGFRWYPCCSQEDTVMRNEFLDEIGDTVFAVAMVAAIGLGAANLAVQVNKERAAFDVAAASQKLGQLEYPQPSPVAVEKRSDEPASQLNY
jgi:hypothetical protein